MILAFFLKMLCDISYYMCFAALIGSMFDVSTHLLVRVLLLALSGTLSMAADSRIKASFLRFVPLAGTAAVVFIRTNMSTAIVLAPAALYLSYICIRRYFRPDYSHTIDSFMALIKLLIPSMVVIIVFGGWRALESYSCPFIIIYALGNILLMRMLRHNESTLAQPSFLIMNGVSIAAVCVLSAVLFSDSMLKTYKATLLIIYRYLIMPILYAICLLAAGIAWVIAKAIAFLASLGSSGQQQHEFPAVSEIESAIENLTETSSTKAPHFLYVIIALLVAAFFIYIFRKLMDKGHGSSESTGTESYSYAATEKKQTPFSWFSPSTPAEQVRFYYRKLLRFFIKKGIPITKNMDTLEIENQACNLNPEKNDKIKRMRLIYQPARYGKGASKQDVAEAKDLYHEIKKT